MDAVTVTTNDGRHIDNMLACEPLMSSFDRLIVVDNVSTDGSPGRAASAGALVVSRETRGGYGDCINLGARQARGPVFAVLNPDITFETGDVVERLSRDLERPGVGVVAPALILPDGRVQDSARQIPTPLDLVIRRLVKPDWGALWDGGDVPLVVGACFLVRREAWDAVGGFDSRFFLYFDDTDLCWRLRKAGWSTYLDSSVTVRHAYGKDSRRPLWAWHTRKHMASAARFYLRYPRFLLTHSTALRSQTAAR